MNGWIDEFTFQIDSFSENKLWQMGRVRWLDCVSSPNRVDRAVFERRLYSTMVGDGRNGQRLSTYNEITHSLLSERYRWNISSQVITIPMDATRIFTDCASDRAHPDSVIVEPIAVSIIQIINKQVHSCHI